MIVLYMACARLLLVGRFNIQFNSKNIDQYTWPLTRDVRMGNHGEIDEMERTIYSQDSDGVSLGVSKLNLFHFSFLAQKT